MSLYGTAEKTEIVAQNWPVNVPAGLAGHLQIISIGYGLGATYSPTTPSGWTQWSGVGHQSEDVSIRTYYRVLASNVSAGTVTIGFTGTVPGVAVAETWRDVDLVDAAVIDDNGAFAQTYTPLNATAAANGFRRDFVARKDARSLVSWPNMTLLADAFVGAANTVSGSAGYKPVVTGNTTGETITIQDAFGGGFDTAPFISSVLLLRSTGSTPIAVDGDAQFADTVTVESISITTPAAFAVAATRDVVVTVTGTDQNPLEGVSVAATAPTIASVDQVTKVTNVSGQVTFTLTGLFAGERQFSVSAGGVSAQTTVIVTGAETTIDAVDDVMTAGNQNTIVVTATDASGNPIINTAVSFEFTGVAVTPVTASAVTNNAGVLNYVIQADTAGQFTARATVSGTESLPVTVTVNPVIQNEAGTISLRGKTYQRGNPIKR